MFEHDSRDLIIYLAVKYQGDNTKILTALHLHEDLQISPEEVKRVVSSLKCKTLTLIDYDYPEKLKQMHRPPIVLFYYGDITLLNDKNQKYGVVGSRDYTEYGEMATRKVVKEMGTKPILVSGLARGIDTIGHETAIENGARTIAVLGSGIDNCYPPENKKLYEKIKKHHLLLSEYPGMVEPDGFHFPLRNRIVVGLSDALVVPQVRSHMSGTMVSVNLMLGMNRKIFVIPAPITEDSINNEIILEGATLAESGGQILDDMKWD